MTKRKRKRIPVYSAKPQTVIAMDFSDRSVGGVDYTVKTTLIKTPDGYEYREEWQTDLFLIPAEGEPKPVQYE